MEGWLTEFPRAHRQGFTKRLRDRHNHQFDAAFFELYLHALLRRLGYSVRVHPRAGNRDRRPDFLAIGSDRSRLLIEAASVGELSDAARAEAALLSAVYDGLNQVHCPDYFLNVEHFGKLSSPVPGRRLRRELTQFLNGLDYEAVSGLARNDLRNFPKCTFLHDHFRLEIGVLPVNPSRRGQPDHRPLGMHGAGEGKIVDHHTPLRDKVCQKAHHYGHLRRPLLIAINDASGHWGATDAMDALFGTERCTLSPRSDDPNQFAYRRAPDGALIGPKGPRNRRVSAVFLVSALLPWTVASAEPVVYHNPWARYPLETLPASILQFRVEGQQMVSRGGNPVHHILGLELRWPNFE